MPEPITRNYKISDEDMIQDARVKREAFIEDKADFIAFDPDFADPFADDFEDDIDAAEATDDDETITDQQMQLTVALQNEMQKCRDKFQDSKIFITKAFPDNAEVQNEFGFNDYTQAQKKQSSFIMFMKKFHNKAEKYKVQLIAENYTQLKIDEILALHDSLYAANVAQDAFIKARPVKTRDRIIKMNKAWEGERTICTAGKRIYKNDYSKYQRYLLPPDEETPEALSIKGTVTNSATNAAEEDVIVTIEANGITVQTNGTGLYGIGGLPAGTYTLKFTKIGLQEKVIANVVVTDGNITALNVAMDSI